MRYSIRIGQTLDERFRITDLIGKGGRATVYEAIDFTTGEVVALKVPHLRFEGDPGFSCRFQREEEIGRLLRHPSILRVLPVPDRSRPYIVMERPEGQLLSDYLAARGALPPQDAVAIAVLIADALIYMHGLKVIYRGLEPKNVMLCADGTLRLIDLGRAKGGTFQPITMLGLPAILRSADYASPEQVRGRGGDERSDIYGLGAVLYKMVTGRDPYSGPDPRLRLQARLVGDPEAPRKINPAVSPELEEVILHALERSPKDRYASVAEMKRDLVLPGRVALTGRPARLLPPTAWRIWQRRLRIYLWASLGALGGLGVLYLLSR